MAAPFAALQARANSAVLAHLANAEATIGAATVQVIFDNGYQTALGGTMETTGPTATGATADLSAAVEGTSLVINSVTYKVVNNQPDGTGMTTLLLEKSA